MKLVALNLFLALLFFITGCGNEKVSTQESLLTNNQSQEPGTTGPNDGIASNGIVGTWKMYLDAYDKNENQVLDDEERKTATPNNYILQLNADGTCRIEQIFTGTYKVMEEKGKKVLEVRRKKVEGEETEDPIPDIYHIKSVTEQEMILLNIDGGHSTTFWIFRREK